MSPLESWLFLLLCFAVLLAAFLGAGRILDWMLDRLFRDPPTRSWVGTEDEETS